MLTLLNVCSVNKVFIFVFLILFAFWSPNRHQSDHWNINRQNWRSKISKVFCFNLVYNLTQKNYHNTWWYPQWVLSIDQLNISIINFPWNQLSKWKIFNKWTHWSNSLEINLPIDLCYVINLIENSFKEIMLSVISYVIM